MLGLGSHVQNLIFILKIEVTCLCRAYLSGLRSLMSMWFNHLFQEILAQKVKTVNQWTTFLFALANSCQPIYPDKRLTCLSHQDKRLPHLQKQLACHTAAYSLGPGSRFSPCCAHQFYTRTWWTVSQSVCLKRPTVGPWSTDRKPVNILLQPLPFETPRRFFQGNALPHSIGLINLALLDHQAFWWSSAKLAVVNPKSKLKVSKKVREGISFVF